MSKIFSNPYKLPPLDPWNGCLRQIHLDFHNSPYVDELATDLDPQALARTFKEAHINSVVVFSKCVHGMGYYPSKVVDPHPLLNGRDIMGEMIDALHAEGIRAPIYTIIAWEQNLGKIRPEWMQQCENGTFPILTDVKDGMHGYPGQWSWLNFLHPDYQDYFETHMLELLNNYPCDGFFLDMLVIHPKADWSETAVEFRKKHGLMGKDALSQEAFDREAKLQFSRRFSKLIRDKAPGASIFYNSDNRNYTDARFGVVTRADEQTHSEIEALPGSAWSYNYFVRLARALRTRKPWLGMTGRFLKFWGDFGSVKPLPALEYECFRTQAMGGANSIGDQLMPRGIIDGGAYRVIGKVFEKCQAAESFYSDAAPVPQIAIVSPNHPSTSEESSTMTEEGMISLCQEFHYDTAVVNDNDDLSAFDLVVVGEGTILTPKLRGNLSRFVSCGGRLICSGNTFLDEQGIGWGPFSGVSSCGESSFAPAYWRAVSTTPLGDALGEDDRVIYQRGWGVSSPTASVWAQRVAPLFQRSDLKYCSHMQAPPRREAMEENAILSTKEWVIFADSIFSEYRRTGNCAVRSAFAAALEFLIGKPATGYGPKSSVLMYPLRKGKSLLLTLLHYIPERKTIELDMIEERMSFAGQVLNFPKPVSNVRNWDSGLDLEKTPNGYCLPNAEGRLLLEIQDFFEGP